MRASEFKNYIDSLSAYLVMHQDDAVQIYNAYRVREGNPEKSGLLSFHNTIGGKNNEFIDSVRTQFLNPEDYIAQWISGLCVKYGNRPTNYTNGYQYIILEMLKNPECRIYIYKFLERSFYRHIWERTRVKPDDTLWEIWFGENKLYWGLLITPVLRRGIWTNDVSEIRRVDFNYWTVGHVLKAGLLDPENNQLVKFATVKEFCLFYQTILKRISASAYEKELMDLYLQYVLHSDYPQDEPLLIPELRFAGKDKMHLYRLDFTIMNIYTQQYVGFEISPQSTHMSIQKVKEKTQTQLNQELSNQWEKESNKRNAYFSNYGISTVTFTDHDLKDIAGCFETIRTYLQARNTCATTLVKAETALKGVIGV